MNRIKTIALAICCAAVSTTTQAAEKPNVIYILADDLGYGDLSILGQKKLQTPNIDLLGSEGIIFTQHYSGNTVCSPSRAVLMTGQHPGNVHCRGNMRSENNTALNPAMTTLPRLFKNAGYATGAYGKWGLGVTSESGAPNPLTHGFDHYSGWKSQGIAHTYYPTSIVRDGKETPLAKGTYIHDLIMADAYQFIEQSVADKQPFFCYIPTAIPHAAMHGPKELHEKWCKVFPEFNNKIGKYGAGKGEPCPDVQNPIAGFAAMIEHLDNQVGEILALLKKLKVDDNTLIIFTSDNGTHSEGGHDPRFWNSNGDFRGIKRDVYDGGIRSPFLARWPARIKSGTTSGHISAFWDILPTMAAIIGQPIPEQADGLSMLPTLTGEASAQKQHQYLYWEFAKGEDQKIFSQAVRMGDWKAVKLKKNGKSELELYNIKNDISETKNVAKQYPKIMDRIEKIILEAHTPLPSQR
ncbi:MAG: arylsulfatase [Rubritalea sp.]|jgi:arylsulfatase A-like enzyme